MTPAQCRAARVLLSWTQSDLAVHAHCSLVTVKRVECGRARVNGTSLSAIRYAVEAAGVDLSMDGGNGENVRVGEPRLMIGGGDWPLPALDVQEQVS